jgi:hypothetical protein
MEMIFKMYLPKEDKQRLEIFEEQNHADQERIPEFDEFGTALNDL